MRLGVEAKYESVGEPDGEVLGGAGNSAGVALSRTVRPSKLG